MPGDVPELPIDAEALATAVKLTGLDASYLQPFDTADPFNDNLPLRGFLSQRPDHRYGGLAITHVGEVPAAQFIPATPKLRYPFGRDGSFHFPRVKRVHLYEKLDGTNVLAYRYADGHGKLRLTYKLRLSPVLRNSRFGPFLDMWREILARHPNISKLAEANACSISFEMYGKRNAHLILYENDLDAAVLFGVDAKFAIVAPCRLDLMGVPAAPLACELSADADPVAKYANVRAEMEQRNHATDDEKLIGTEGMVWYFEDPTGLITMWKCKPESVEEIHWAAGINKKAVIATCWNFLETADNLTYESLQPLLLEEYTQEDIEKFSTNIRQSIEAVKLEFEFREHVLAKYDALAAKGMSIHTDKGAVMRELSKQFERSEMKKVFSAISMRRKPPEGQRTIGK